MKKLLMLFVAFVSIISVSAQEVDALHIQSATVSIDSLSMKLKKLQHDYDFIYCDYELHKLISNLNNLSQSIEISSNGAFINVYNSRYDRALYVAYSDKYDADRTLFNSLKDNIEVVKVAVLLKVATSDFSEQEVNVIKACFALIQNSTAKIEKALNYYDVAIQAYRSKRY